MSERTRPITRATRAQWFAQLAYGRIEGRATSLQGKKRKEFTSFAKRFPSLIHSCGLAQALAFAQAKEEKDYLADLAGVMSRNAPDLLADARNKPVTEYMHLSRETLTAAGWLKRYAEALMDDETDEQKGGE